jgi:hypothetical protein
MLCLPYFWKFFDSLLASDKPTRPRRKWDRFHFNCFSRRKLNKFEDCEIGNRRRSGAPSPDSSIFQSQGTRHDPVVLYIVDIDIFNTDRWY